MELTQEASSSSTNVSDPQGLQVVAQTPEKSNLCREVSQMRGALYHTESEAETVVKQVNVDALSNDKALLEHQKTDFERTAS